MYYRHHFVNWIVHFEDILYLFKFIRFSTPRYNQYKWMHCCSSFAMGKAVLKFLHLRWFGLFSYEYILSKSSNAFWLSISNEMYIYNAMYVSIIIEVATCCTRKWTWDIFVYISYLREHVCFKWKVDPEDPSYSFVFNSILFRGVRFY